MVTLRLIGAMLAVAVLLLPAHEAAAASLSFRFLLSGAELTVENRGGATAFYPTVFRIAADGSWHRLGTSSATAQLLPGATLKLDWSDTRPDAQFSAIGRMQPVMVRFFDQAGVGFGQIAFLRTPTAVPASLKASYDGSVLQIEPPSNTPAVHATWVLWAREEGIGPIRFPVRFEHRPPPALRIDWRRQGPLPYRLDTGAGQPEVFLVHETEQGLALQSVAGGKLQGREQRAAWLDAAPRFYAVALIALIIATGTIVGQRLRWLRKRTES